MVINIGEWYHIKPVGYPGYCSPDFSSFNSLSEGDYRIVDVCVSFLRKGRTEYIQEGFKVENCPALFPVQAHIITPIGPCTTGLLNGPSRQRVTPEQLVRVYQFSKRTGLTLPEALYFFEDEQIFNWGNTSEKSKRLFLNLELIKGRRDDCLDSLEKKIYDIQIELLDMLLIESLHNDYHFVPEILYPEIVKENC